MSVTSSKYSGLAKQLVSDGVVSEESMQTAQTEAQPAADRTGPLLGRQQTGQGPSSGSNTITGLRRPSYSISTL